MDIDNQGLQSGLDYASLLRPSYFCDELIVVKKKNVFYKRSARQIKKDAKLLLKKGVFFHKSSTCFPSYPFSYKRALADRHQATFLGMEFTPAKPEGAFYSSSYLVGRLDPGSRVNRGPGVTHRSRTALGGPLTFDYETSKLREALYERFPILTTPNYKI